MNRLVQKYRQDAVPALQQEFGYRNLQQVPRLEKVVINVGAGRAAADSKVLETAMATVSKISGQSPVQTVAKKSIAGFKLREGNKIGAKVTLRGERMYDFVDRLVSIVLPRIRDFRGLSTKAFDPQGNYSIGVDDQSIFPEISFDEITTTHGLQVNIVTTAKTAAEGKKLLELLGFPFKKESK
jgi:large subunit ribosomal protein L5